MTASGPESGRASNPNVTLEYSFVNAHNAGGWDDRRAVVRPGRHARLGLMKAAWLKDPDGNVQALVSR
jgi:hypothetical protein